MSPEAARAAYDGGTSWPREYDTRTLVTLETSETVAEEIPNPWLHKQADGTVIDIAGCWWDLPATPTAQSEDPA